MSSCTYLVCFLNDGITRAHRADLSLFERGQWFENDRGCASSTFWYNSISFWPYKNASMFFFIFFLNYHFREAAGCLAYDIRPIQVIFHLEWINQCASNSLGWSRISITLKWKRVSLCFKKFGKKGIDSNVKNTCFNFVTIVFMTYSILYCSFPSGRPLTH